MEMNAQWCRKGSLHHRLDTREAFRRELKAQFLLKNVEHLAWKNLKHLKHDVLIQDYVKKSATLMLDIKDMLEEDQLFFFIDGLQPWAKQVLQRLKCARLGHSCCHRGETNQKFFDLEVQFYWWMTILWAPWKFNFILIKISEMRKCLDVEFSSNFVASQWGCG